MIVRRIAVQRQPRPCAAKAVTLTYNRNGDRLTNVDSVSGTNRAYGYDQTACHYCWWLARSATSTGRTATPS